MLRKLRRLSKLSTGELLVFSQLLLLALIARISLVFIALPRVTAFVAWGANRRFLRCLPLFNSHYEMTQLTCLADLAARGTRADGPCLIRSLLLLWLLKARGEQVELLIGVHKDGAVFNSHAWIKSRGIIVGDSEESALHFNTLLRL